ncbi:MAG: hypothetical protein EHM28_08345 [Spirochaetaceae bacterium]|nr:MAG: hypothetical protein EHM28_08345 [Spirochaetaceae bacterium]
MKEKLLMYARLAVVAGVILMATGIFFETNNVASLSTAKADLEVFKKSIEEKYKVEKPAYPVDFSLKLTEPAKPGDSATPEATTLYETRLKEYEELKKKESEAYTAAKAAYDKVYADYLYNKSKMDYNKARDDESIKKQIERMEKAIANMQITINVISLSVIFRFIGVILLLAGALGILVYAENMEKLGVLVMLGFAFKTIIGL